MGASVRWQAARQRFVLGPTGRDDREGRGPRADHARGRRDDAIAGVETLDGTTGRAGRHPRSPHRHTGSLRRGTAQGCPPDPHQDLPRSRHSCRALRGPRRSGPGFQGRSPSSQGRRQGHDRRDMGRQVEHQRAVQAARRHRALEEGHCSGRDGRPLRAGRFALGPVPSQRRSGSQEDRELTARQRPPRRSER